MPHDDAEAPLVFRQEEASVRATAGGLNILFPKSDREAIMQAFDEWRPRVHDHFEPRWHAHSGANIPRADLEAIVREVTLQWMCYHTMHRTPIQMSEAEWDQPLTRRIIRETVERRFARGSDEATALCAQLMGVSREQYLKWAQGEDTFLGVG
jgi:hypothetical protein